MNDPFIPLHYMVYSLKFDMAHCKSFRKDSQYFSIMLSGRYEEDEVELGAYIVQLFCAHTELSYKAVLRLFGHI